MLSNPQQLISLMRTALLYLPLWLAALLPASSKDVFVDGGGGGGYTSMGGNSVALPDVATHGAGNTSKKHPRSKEYDDFRRRFDEMAKGTVPIDGTDGALRYGFTPTPGIHGSWHWSVKTEAGTTGNANASARASLGNPSLGGSVTSHAEAVGTGSASASASSSGSVTISPGAASVVSAPPPAPASAPAPDATVPATEVAATPIVAAVTEQPMPSIIILEPPPRPPRIITTNDLPHSTFSGEVLGERAGLLNYQARQAAKGTPEALYAMGVRYPNGIDVSKNYALARDYLEAAKKKGNLRARAKLEELTRGEARSGHQPSGAILRVEN
jgi:hypothetical protein